MGNFRTEDDFTPHGGENFSDYGGYDNRKSEMSQDTMVRLKNQIYFPEY